MIKLILVGAVMFVLLVTYVLCAISSIDDRRRERDARSWDYD